MPAVLGSTHGEGAREEKGARREQSTTSKRGVVAATGTGWVRPCHRVVAFAATPTATGAVARVVATVGGALAVALPLANAVAALLPAAIGGATVKAVVVGVVVAALLDDERIRVHGVVSLVEGNLLEKVGAGLNKGGKQYLHGRTVVMP